MQRAATVFIIICMALIAAAVGVVLYVAAGLSAADSALIGLVVLSALAVGHTTTARLRDRTDLEAQITGLSGGVAELARQVGELGRRTVALETRSEAVAERLHGATRPLTAEVAELASLVRQLAESVAVHDVTLAKHMMSGAPAAAESVDAPAQETFEFAPAAPAVRDGALPHDRMTAVIRSAIDANRVDLYLQPIVALPQRKVRYYEALARLRTEDGRSLEPAEFLEPAEMSGLIARLDHMMLLRCVQVLRRLQQKNRDIGLFCNLSAVTLNDPQFFPQMSQYMDANRVLAPTLLIDFRQSAWRAMGPLELESLAALREVGFRFGMDQVTDLRIEPRDLADRGIRFVKTPAALLLGRAGAASTAGTDIHVADLSGLLARFGVHLIASQIENETEVVDLLDYELKFGQGNLFSPPRPVRAEALQVGADGLVGDAAGQPPEMPAARAAAN